MKKIDSFKDLKTEIKNLPADTILFIDGASGSGKTTMTKKILEKVFGVEDEEVLAQSGKTALDSDLFLGKNTNDLSEMINADTRNEIITNLPTNNNSIYAAVKQFKEVFRNESGLSDILKNILYAQENNIISFSRKKVPLYNRVERKTEPRQLSIKVSDKRPFIINGTNISEVAKQVASEVNKNIVTLNLETDPHYSLLSALFRDMERGRLEQARRGAFRVSDLFFVTHIQQKIKKDNLIDINYKDPTIFTKVLKEQKKNGEMNERKIKKFYEYLQNLKDRIHKTEYEKYPEEIQQFVDTLWKKSEILKKRHFSEYFKD